MTRKELHEKYPNRDFIEISYDHGWVMSKWIGEVSITEMVTKMGKFPIFLKSGIISVYGNDLLGRYVNYEFIDDQNIIISLNVQTDDYIFRTVKKVTINVGDIKKQKFDFFNHLDDVDDKFLTAVYDTTRNSDLLKEASEIAENIRKSHPNCFDSKKLINQLLLSQTLWGQFVLAISVNSFLVYNDKVKLYSKIEQKRQLTKNDNKKNKKHNRTINPFYRYVVELPKDYVPQKIDRNYIMSEWCVSGHTREIRVRIENAEALANRSGGKILWESAKNGYVKIKRPINATTARRKEANGGIISYKSYAA